MKSFTFILLVFFMTSCAPIRVDYDFERSADFSKYKTYNYYSNMNTGLSELDTKRLLKALDTNLQGKGISLSETPDFFIDIKSSDFQETRQNTVGVGLGGGGRHVGGGISVGIPVGQSNVNRQIIFDFVDENANGLFWQAVSESTYKQNASPEKREADFNAIVAKVLQGFPPKK